ncbi:hypothetical protein [Chamaesiphon sp. VAR_69_metabat_338]|uniref:hypothetical protein n=1 Tax=Chamaesiphon sp. VAR_69_metabat_338 TaxID=2964704 RepID=UPI00286E01B3|nr:hypothetical protein [Chamaesiphon sp. VAR_69_metabat_338]
MCGLGDREVRLAAIASSHIYSDLTDDMKIGGATVLSIDTLPSHGIVDIIDRVWVPGAIDLARSIAIGF